VAAVAVDKTPEQGQLLDKKVLVELAVVEMVEAAMALQEVLTLAVAVVELVLIQHLPLTVALAVEVS